MRFDHWGVEYNTALHAELSDLEPKHPENLDIELPRDQWRPLHDAPHTLPWSDLLFVDGRRRVEARVFFEDDTRQLAFGLLGTTSVGVVSCCPQGLRRAEFHRADDRWRNERVCIVSSGHKGAVGKVVIERLGSRLGHLEYRISGTDSTDEAAVINCLQDEMLQSERDLTAQLTQELPGALVICDGRRPLTNYSPNVVGYVKTIHKVDIGHEQLEVVRQLKEGERSPIYLMSPGKDKEQYFEWFLRLRDPRPWYYTLAGIVRMQAYAGTDIEARKPEVINLANWTAACMPRFASRQYQDPRAPQQLLPVRALERELGRRMGSMEIIRRRVMRHLAAQEATA